VKFGSLLATYDITIEEYIGSFDNKQLFMKNSEFGAVKSVLSRSDIKLTSYLFSSKFVGFIDKDNYFSERFAIDDNAICSNALSMIATTSNTCEL
jgi:hypothetical protein